MCTSSCVMFGARKLSREDVRGKRVLEVGSYDVNGTLRPMIESWGPAEYIGADIESGPGVDLICRAEDLERKLGQDSFDLVVSTEVLEHVRGWREAVSAMKRVCRPGGALLLTTRSYGFGYHGHPYDFWRFEVEDMKVIFSDFEDLEIEKDPQSPGVFLKARKPLVFTEKTLSGYELYNISLGLKAVDISDADLRSGYLSYIRFKERMKGFLYAAERAVFRFLSTPK